MIDKTLRLNVAPVPFGSGDTKAEDAYLGIIRGIWISQHGSTPANGSVGLSLKIHQEVPRGLSREQQDNLIYNGHSVFPTLSELHSPIILALEGVAFKSLYFIEELHSEKLWVRPGNSLVEITVTELYESKRRIARKPIARANTGGN